MQFYKYGVELFSTGAVYNGEKDSSHWKILGNLLKLEYFILNLCRFNFDYEKIYYDGVNHYDLKIGFIEINFGKIDYK